MAKTAVNSFEFSCSTVIINKSRLDLFIQSLQHVSGESETYQAMLQLAQVMRLAEGQEFQLCLKGLNYLFRKGYTSMFISHLDLLKKMMDYFTLLARQLQDNNDDQNTELRMLYALSTIAQLIRKNPKFLFPFKKKFLLTIFRIDYELLQKNLHRKDILAILAVIYQNFARQGRLINKYSMIESLKKSVLENYSLIQDFFTLKAFNRALCHLVNKGVSLSTKEFVQYKIFETLRFFMQPNQTQLFAVKIRIAFVLLGKHETNNQEMCYQQNL